MAKARGMPEFAAYNSEEYEGANMEIIRMYRKKLIKTNTYLNIT